MKSVAKFIGHPYLEKFSYGADQLAATKLIARLKQSEFTKIRIDENCILVWATAFYKAMPTACKDDFIGDDTWKHKTIGEIRKYAPS